MLSRKQPSIHLDIADGEGEGKENLIELLHHSDVSVLTILSIPELIWTFQMKNPTGPGIYFFMAFPYFRHTLCDALHSQTLPQMDEYIAHVLYTGIGTYCVFTLSWHFYKLDLPNDKRHKHQNRRNEIHYSKKCRKALRDPQASYKTIYQALPWKSVSSLNKPYERIKCV